MFRQGITEIGDNQVVEGTISRFLVPRCNKYELGCHVFQEPHASADKKTNHRRYLFSIISWESSGWSRGLRLSIASMKDFYFRRLSFIRKEHAPLSALNNPSERHFSSSELHQTKFSFYLIQICFSIIKLNCNEITKPISE